MMPFGLGLVTLMVTFLSAMQHPTQSIISLKQATTSFFFNIMASRFKLELISI